MMKLEQIQEAIRQGEAVCGIELGSTRIKAVLIGPDHTPIATGAFDWENQRAGGVWTYPLELAWQGIQAAYAQMAQEVERAYGEPLRKLGALGFSAMMHGYLPLDKEGNQLCEFRTWRNTMTAKAAEELTALLRQDFPSEDVFYRLLEQEEDGLYLVAWSENSADVYVYQLEKREDAFVL